MINYEEELKRFQPALEVNQAEEAIYNNDLKDLSDILMQMAAELREPAEMPQTMRRMRR